MKKRKDMSTLDDFDTSPVMYGEPETWDKKVDEHLADESKKKTKREMLDEMYARGYALPEEVDFSQKIGYNDATMKLIFKHNEVRKRKDGKYRDGSGAEYSIPEAVEQNIKVFKQRKELKLGSRNSNNDDPELIDYQRKNHFKFWKPQKAISFGKDINAIANSYNKVDLRTEPSALPLAPVVLPQQSQPKHWIEIEAEKIEKRKKENASKGIAYLMGI